MKTSRHFGEISPTIHSVDAEVALGVERVRVDLNLARPDELDPAEITTIDQLLDEVARLDESARGMLASLMDNEDAQPAQFWRFHREDVAGYEALEREGFVAALRLQRIGFYPDGAYGSRAFLVMDYILREPKTDQVLAVKLQRDATLQTIAWES
jgi:hypothetical protein